MTGLIVALGLMALSAHAISLGDQGIAVRLMAITANHSRSGHLALHEGAVDINFISNLSVVPVKRCLNRGYSMGVAQGFSELVITEGGASGMTATAALYLG